MKSVFICISEFETESLAAALAAKAVAGDCFSLVGTLGAGKTLFAKAFAAALDVDDDVSSPTFNLMNEYEGRLHLYHFDLYRIAEAAEFDELNFEEYWEGNGVSLVEWGDNAHGRLPRSSILVRIEPIDETTRRITVEYPDD